MTLPNDVAWCDGLVRANVEYPCPKAQDCARFRSPRAEGQVGYLSWIYPTHNPRGNCWAFISIHKFKHESRT